MLIFFKIRSVRQQSAKTGHYGPEKFLEGKGSGIFFEENISKDTYHIINHD